MAEWKVFHADVSDDESRTLTGTLGMKLNEIEADGWTVFTVLRGRDHLYDIVAKK